MSPGGLHLSAWGNGGQPVAERGMSCVGGCPIDRVHLLAMILDGHINEESGTREACAAPNDIRSSTGIPRCGLCDNSLALGGISEISTDIVEFLREPVTGSSLMIGEQW